MSDDETPRIRTKPAAHTLPDHGFIYVWEFHKAPEIFQSLSGNGGDEDWLVLIPPSMTKHGPPYIAWCEDYSPNFGCAGVEVIDIGEGWQIRIGSHA